MVKKGDQWHFEMKLHIWVDSETGVVTAWLRRRLMRMTWPNAPACFTAGDAGVGRFRISEST